MNGFNGHQYLCSLYQFQFGTNNTKTFLSDSKNVKQQSSVNGESSILYFTHGAGRETLELTRVHEPTAPLDLDDVNRMKVYVYL